RSLADRPERQHVVPGLGGDAMRVAPGCSVGALLEHGDTDAKGTDMPFYQRRGEVPRKRHIVFRENGRLLTEEVMGLEGFTGNESILYHLESPCRVKELG